jgi:Domain of unknown function (DUF4157)
MKRQVTGSKTQNASGKQEIAVPRSMQNTLLRPAIGNRELQRLIQAKLQVSQPSDVYEQEADRVAKQVVTMPTSQIQSTVQMREAMPTEPAKHSMGIGSLAESVAQRDASPGEIIDMGEDVEKRIEQSMGKGIPLPDQIRSFMEPRFGTDFSGVRVHTGHDAIQMNESLSAQAFTVGPDIYFGSGKSPSDLELTAHELTHVVQQGGGQKPSKEIESRDASEGRGMHRPVPDKAASNSVSRSSAFHQGVSRRIIQRRGVPIPPSTPIPSAPTNSVDGSIVVSKLNDMGGAMWGGFEGFNGTRVERDIVRAFGSGILQPRSIGINFRDERGMNMIWTGSVNIRMESPTQLQGSGGSGVGKVNSGGGGSGSSGTTFGSENSDSASVEISGGGHEGAVGGNAGASTSSTTSESESQGTSGVSTFGAETTDRLQRYECTIIADIFLRCEPDFSGSDYFNPFKWGFAGAGAIDSAINGPIARSDSVACGQWTYQVSTGFASPAPTP